MLIKHKRQAYTMSFNMNHREIAIFQKHIKRSHIFDEIQKIANNFTELIAMIRFSVQHIKPNHVSFAV